MVQNLAFLDFGKHVKAASILIIGTCERAKALQLCPTLAWPIACQAPLSMGFSRQEHWSGLPCPPAGDLPDPKTEPTFLTSPVLAGGFFATSATWEFLETGNCCYMFPQVLASAELSWFNLTGKDLPGSVSGNNLPAKAEDIRYVDYIAGSGRSSGGGHGSPLWYCCLESHGQKSLASYSP